MDRLGIAFAFLGWALIWIGLPAAMLGGIGWLVYDQSRDHDACRLTGGVVIQYEGVLLCAPREQTTTWKEMQ